MIALLGLFSYYFNVLLGILALPYNIKLIKQIHISFYITLHAPFPTWTYAIDTCYCGF